jgi:putative ABC transport system substrate-binding protein
VARAAVTETEAAGRTLGVRVTTTVVSNSNEVEHAFSSIRDARVGGIVVGLALRPYWKQILHLARQSRLPTVSGPREFVEAGGLMAYGPDYPDLYRRAATYVDKILKGPIRLTSLSSSQPSSSWSSTPRPPRHWA